MFLKNILCLILIASNLAFHKADSKLLESYKLKYTINESDGIHRQRIKGAACSDDGKWLTSIGSSLKPVLVEFEDPKEVYEIKTWSLADNSNRVKLMNTFDDTNGGHIDSINDVIYEIDAKFLTASDDKSIKALDASNYFDPPIATLPDSAGFSSPVSNLAIIKDKYENNAGIVARFDDGNIQVWKDGKIQTISASSEFFVVLSDTYLASVSDSYDIEIWNLDNGNLKVEFNETNGGHTYGIVVVVSLQNNLFASGDRDGEIKIWDFEKERLVYSFGPSNKGHKKYINSLVYLKNDYLASASADKTLKVWDVKRGQLKYTIARSSDSGPFSSFESLSLLENYLLAVSGYKNFESVIEIYNLNTEELRHTFGLSDGGHTGSRINGLIACGTNRLLSFTDSDIKIWEVKATPLWPFPNGSQTSFQLSQFALLFSIMAILSLIVH